MSNVSVEIIPAILESSLDDVSLCLESIKGASRAVQIDVVDGVYAPNRTWPYTNAAQQKEFARIAAQEEGLPFWEDFDFEIDLMVAHPERAVFDWVYAGASRIIVHTNSVGALEALHKLQDMRGELGFGVGIALACSDTSESLESFSGLYDFAQVMGIEKVGFQGQDFDSRALVLLRKLKEKYPDLQLQIDGGVGYEHVRECADVGATRITSGSAIFNNDDPRGALRELRAIIKS